MKEIKLKEIKITKVGISGNGISGNGMELKNTNFLKQLEQSLNSFSK